MVNVLQIPLLHGTVCNIVDHESRYVHRVLGGGVRRCIGQIQVFELSCSHACMDGGSQHIDPLVHTLVTYDLSAQQAAGPLLKDHLHGHQLSAGVITRVAHGGQDHFVHIQPRLFCIGLVDAGSGGSYIKYLDHAASLRPQIAAVAAADIVRNDAPLLVGGTGQGDQGILAGDIVLHLHRIASGIDVRHRCLHPVVDHDTALDPQFQTSFFRESGVRRDADGQHRHADGRRTENRGAQPPLLRSLSGRLFAARAAVAAGLCGVGRVEACGPQRGEQREGAENDGDDECLFHGSFCFMLCGRRSSLPCGVRRPCRGRSGRWHPARP